MLVGGSVAEALEIIARVPTVFLAGMIVLLASTEFRQWVVHKPYKSWEDKTGISADFGGVRPLLYAAPVAIVAGICTYLFGGFLTVLSVVVSVIATGSAPVYQEWLYIFAALGVLVTIGVQLRLALRIRKFLAWGV